jgi:hypothetical protein
MIKSIALGFLFFVLFVFVSVVELIFIGRLYPAVNELSQVSPTIFGVDFYYFFKVFTVIAFTTIISIFTQNRKMVFISYIGFLVSYDVICNLSLFGQLTASSFLLVREGTIIFISGIVFTLTNRFIRAKHHL